MESSISSSSSLSTFIIIIIIIRLSLPYGTKRKLFRKRKISIISLLKCYQGRPYTPKLSSSSVSKILVCSSKQLTEDSLFNIFIFIDARGYKKEKKSCSNPLKRMWPDIPEARREHPEGHVGAQKYTQ